KILRALAEKEGRKPRRHRIWARPDRWQIELVRRAYPLGLHWVLDRIGTRFARRVARRAIGSVDAPGTLDAAYATLGPDTTVVGGGSDALLQRRQNLIAPTRIVSLGEIEALAVPRAAAGGADEGGRGLEPA